MKSREWKKRITFLTIFLLFSIALQSFLVCAQAQRYTRYTLTATVNDPGAGSVSPWFGIYSYGDVVTLTAQANQGYLFDGWYLNGNFQGKTSTLTLTMYRNQEVLALFSKRLATLTITANPLGAGSTAPSAGVWAYALGSSILAKAYPVSGKVFDGWFLDGVYVGTSIEYTVLIDRDHQLDAYFADEQTVRPLPETDESKIKSVLEFSCKSSASYSALSANIRGGLTSNGIAVANAPILISYSVTAGSSWTDLTLVTTDNEGNFRATWMPQVTGDYKIKAAWNGNATFAKTSATIDFAMTPFEKESIFSVTSNSTLSQLSFNSNSSQLSFSVEGPSGTTGYVYVYIPKVLMSDVSNLKVWMDQKQLIPTIQSDGDSWLVYFTYNHSIHFVTVDLIGAASVAVTFNDMLLYAISVAVVIVIVVVSVVMLKRRKKA